MKPRPAIFTSAFLALPSATDQLFFDQIKEAATKVHAVRQAAGNDSIGKFQLVFGEITVAMRAQQSILRSRLLIFLCVAATPLMMQGSLDLGLPQLAL